MTTSECSVGLADFSRKDVVMSKAQKERLGRPTDRFLDVRPGKNVKIDIDRAAFHEEAIEFRRLCRKLRFVRLICQEDKCSVAKRSGVYVVPDAVALICARRRGSADSDDSNNDPRNVPRNQQPESDDGDDDDDEKETKENEENNDRKD